MEVKNKATKIDLFSLATPQMRTFHMTWFAFFLCFFGWFGIAPLMVLVREDLMLTKAQIGNTIIASVAITVIVRIIIGPLCDRFGSRLVYTWLLLLGSLPVMGIGLAQSYESFLLFRLAIGAIGASFVITQYHTSMMFGPNCVGTANATTAGWGNLGGGVTQMIMPLILGAIFFFGVSESLGWRLAMIVPGAVLFLTGIGYYFCTQDAPDGNYQELRARGELPPAEGSSKKSFWLAAKDYRVWALFVIYAACFGVELTINNIAALYFYDFFKLDLATAGIIAGLFGLMNIFARTLGGIFSDICAVKIGLRGRVWFMGAVLLAEGIALVVFSADERFTAGDHEHDRLQPICPNVRRRDLCGRSFYQQKSTRWRGRHCGCRRERRSGCRRISVSLGESQYPARPVDSGHCGCPGVCLYVFGDLSASSPRGRTAQSGKGSGRESSISRGRTHSGNRQLIRVRPVRRQR